MNNLLITNSDARRVIDEVMSKVHESVVSTMGPNGRLAMIASGVSTKTTKDGVTVARSIKFSEPGHELVNRVITEPAIKTDRECGDGTTTTILLTSALYEVFKEFPGFSDQRVIESLIGKVIEGLGILAIRVGVDDPRLYQMALTSSNQDAELAKMVTDIYKESGSKFPVIELKEGLTLEDKVERIEGRVLRMHYSNPIFGKGQSGGEFIFDRFFPVVIDNRLSNPDPVKLAEALRHVIFNSAVIQQFPLLLIARSVEQDFISEIIGWCNANRSILANSGYPAVIPLNTNMGGSIGTSEMQDLAAMLNAPMITDIYDLANIEVLENRCTLTLGISRSFLTDLTADDEARIETQAASIETMMEQYSMSDRFSLRGKLNEKRVRNLRGELVTIHVGGETNSEIKERVDRYEDVVKAVRSGLENGILPGGGTSLMMATGIIIRAFREDNPNMNPALLEKYVAALVNVGTASYRQLFDGIVPAPTEFELMSRKVYDLASGEMGTPEELGVYDTAYAAITALKGGLQTAKILANTNSLILGDKVHAVNIPR